MPCLQAVVRQHVGKNKQKSPIPQVQAHNYHTSPAQFFTFKFSKNSTRLRHTPRQIVQMQCKYILLLENGALDIEFEQGLKLVNVRQGLMAKLKAFSLENGGSSFIESTVLG